MHQGVRHQGRRSCAAQLAVDEHCCYEGQELPRSRAGEQVPGLPRMLGPQRPQRSLWQTLEEFRF